MIKLRVVEPLYRKTLQGGLIKVGYRVNEILTKKNGDIIKCTFVKTKMYNV